MDTYDQELKQKVDAWVREQLTASPEWGRSNTSPLGSTLRARIGLLRATGSADGAPGLALKQMERHCWPLPEG